MILVLSGSGSEARAFSALLEKEGMEHLCVLPSLQEAAAFGCGNVVVGRFGSREMEQLLKEEKVWGVADVDADGIAMSEVAMTACENLEIPYIKYLPLPNTARELVTGTVGSYKEVAEGIDCLSGSAILYTTPAAAMAIAKRVKSPEKLYAPILRGSSFDVEKALEYGLPLLNILEADSPEGLESVTDLIQKVGARLLVCDGSWELPDKLAAAEAAKIPLVLTHKTGIEYTHTAWNNEALFRALRGWGK
ncbi:MAG: precorrin-6A/cobalt-precorrin-6A reductase [Clostridia bacterium]|nr:precorrin-6A/cobalt-precorrin-6A reductase [Clostridia bacterium]